MKKLCTIIFLLFIALNCLCEAKSGYVKDNLVYSQEYFDSLIDESEIYREQNTKDNIYNSVFEECEFEEEILTDDITPFHLRIEKGIDTPVFKDSFKKADTKTIIPISNKFSFIHDTLKTRNKYNSHDYKILTGAEYQISKFLNLSSGLETNYRGLDQNPDSRKVYFSPQLSFGDKISLKFHNKINIQNYSTDHDIGLNISPFKSKIMDLGVYSGLTRKQNGAVSESINFTTNFYF